MRNPDGSFLVVCKAEKKIEVSFESFNGEVCRIESKNKDEILFSEGIDGIFQEKYSFSSPSARIFNSDLIMEKGLSVNSETFSFSSNSFGFFDKSGKITLNGEGTKVAYLESEIHTEKVVVEDGNFFLYGDSYYEDDVISFFSKGPIYFWDYKESDVLSAKNIESLKYFLEDKKVLNVDGSDFLIYFYEDEFSMRVSDFSLALDNYSLFSKKISIQRNDKSLKLHSIEGEIEIKNRENSIYTKDLILFDDLSWKAVNGVRVVF